MEQQRKIILLLIIFSVLSIVFYIASIIFSSPVSGSYLTSIFTLSYLLLLFLIMIGGIYSIYRQVKRDFFWKNLIYFFLFIIDIIIFAFISAIPFVRGVVCVGKPECLYGIAEMVLVFISIFYFISIFVINSIIYFVQRSKSNKK